LRVGQITIAAVAALGRMLDVLISDRDALKASASMTLLAALLASRPLAQPALLRISRRLGQPV